jgi:hypothetical protein
MGLIKCLDCTRINSILVTGISKNGHNVLIFARCVNTYFRSEGNSLYQLPGYLFFSGEIY